MFVAVIQGLTMKIGVILYHKDISKYKQNWVDKCVMSLEMQTYQDFSVFELCYADTPTTVADYIGRTPMFPLHMRDHRPLKNHVHAQNYLLDTLFKVLNFEYVFNVNLDDFYDRRRIELQLSMIEKGYDIVAADFQHVEEGPNGYDVFGYKFPASSYSVGEELMRDHNVVGHSSVCYSKKFWLTFSPYPDTIPHEDLDLWKRSVKAGAIIGIYPETLMYYRRHSQQICK